MKTLRLGREDISKGDLILVNPSHPLHHEGRDGRKECLVSVDRRLRCCGYESKEAGEDLYLFAGTDTPAILLERQTAKMLWEIMTRLDCEERIVPISGYRTLREQQTIWADSLREHGEEYTGKYVAIPGCSEHQTGLAVDLAENGDAIDLLCPDFPQTGICGRFRELSVRYGFIERYPAGREQITGIAYEPWHFRYVGYPHSEIIREMDFTLEEYFLYLKQFPYPGVPLGYQLGRHSYEIFYVPVPPGKETAVEIPDRIPCQVSGNNEDGVVVTLWRDRL